MKLLLKIGGSLLAPKDSNQLDNDYVVCIGSWFRQFDEVVVVHGAGSVGHSFVQSHGTSHDVIPLLRSALSNFWFVLDESWGLSRITYDMIGNWSNGSVTVGGDITDDGVIVSGDDMFAQFLSVGCFDCAMMLTDIDGVLDDNGVVIDYITTATFASIGFWSKEGDVTGGMRNKLSTYFDSNIQQGFWIVNGYDLANVDAIIQTGSGIGTFISR